MAMSRMAVPLRIDEQNDKVIRIGIGDSKSQKTRERRRMIRQLNQDVVIINDFLNSLHREIHTSGVNFRDINEVLTFVENKRIQLVHILQEIDENDKTARFNLSNLINFLRRIQERIDDFMKVISKLPKA